MHIIQYNVFIRGILQSDAFISNNNYTYVIIWTILITLYHVEVMFLKTGDGVTIHNYLLRQIICLVRIIIQFGSM